MIRCFAPIIGLLGALAPALAQAQTNLDQGKSASQIFASACAECHKAAHGLAHGKNGAALADFLREHYTTNSQQAAALAAYVLGGAGGTPIGALPQVRGQKPKTEQASASTEEPKPSKPRATRLAKPEDGKPANTKLRRPTREAAKPKDEASPSEQPSIAAPEGGKSKHRPAMATRGRVKEPKNAPPMPEPEAVVHTPAATAEPAATEAPNHDVNPSPAPSAVVPGANAASGESGENAPVPRDHIPD